MHDEPAVWCVFVAPCSYFLLNSHLFSCRKIYLFIYLFTEGTRWVLAFSGIYSKSQNSSMNSERTCINSIWLGKDMYSLFFGRWWSLRHQSIHRSMKGQKYKGYCSLSYHWSSSIKKWIHRLFLCVFCISSLLLHPPLSSPLTMFFCSLCRSLNSHWHTLVTPHYI